MTRSRVIVLGLCVFCFVGRLNAQVTEKEDTITRSVVTAIYDERDFSSQTGLTRMDASVFKSGYAVLGTPDVLKTLQQLPGVASGSELSSGLYVRGGDGSDNLFLLDGVPLYQVSHLFGLYSSFNVDVIDHLDFYKSGFPARYGGRLSSVVDVTTADGDFEHYKGIFSVGSSDARFQIEGPIVKGRTSFNFGVRSSYLDLIALPAVSVYNAIQAHRKNDERYGFHYIFWDINGKITHRIDERNTLVFNVYSGEDDFGFKMKYLHGFVEAGEKYDAYEQMKILLRWGNAVSQLQWKDRISQSLSSDVSLWWSRSKSRMSFDMDEVDWENVDGMKQISMHSSESNISLINDFGAKADFDWRPSRKNHLRFGAMYQYHLYKPERSTARSYTDVEGQYRGTDRTNVYGYRGHEADLYMEDEITPFDWLRMGLGLRASLFAVKGKAYPAFEPRMSFKFQCTDWMSAKLAYTEMNQFAHQVSTVYIDLPMNCWMPSTANVRPMHSRQVAGGFHMELPHALRLEVEAWYKTMDHLLQYGGASGIYPPLDNWETSFSEGRGKTYGAEFYLAYDKPRLKASVAYTLSWSLRRFDDFYDGWFRDHYDNRHKITLSASGWITRKFELYASWNYHSGNRMTVADQAIQNNGDPYFDSHFGEGVNYGFDFIYSKPNNLKLPDYHRFDLGLNWHRTTRHGREAVWNVSIYNLYCRMNPMMAMVERNGNSFTYKAIGMIPIIPSFSYTLNF